MSNSTEKHAPANFIRHMIDEDVSQNKWGGRFATRFPPEPNGYLHYGHAKSICLNFGLARDYGGQCHMRFDDTNPEKEEQEYVDAILDAVHWLGFDWGAHQFFASDYFDRLYALAEFLIQQGMAYVDSQTAEAMREHRGTHLIPGQNSPFRERSVADNLDLFRRMKAGEFPDGAHVLRAKIDMASPNFNLRDPVLYRIRHAEHHRTGNLWCIYPLYDYTHCISDALERITHSICTLEFEDHRPLYDWVLDQLAPQLGWHPQQIEFARLNLTYVVLSKRKLIQLVESQAVDSWDDPRLPTLVGARRRGFTAAGFRLFTDRIGVSKADSWIDMSVLEECMREDLNLNAERRIAVLNPIRLILDNYPENLQEDCFAPNHPLKPELGKRAIPLSKELWIEREDYMETPSKGFFRLYPGNRVRLRYAYVIECTRADYDANGQLLTVHAEYLPDTKSGTAGSDSVKVKGNIHWLPVKNVEACEVRLYDRLFSVPHPGTEQDFMLDINPDSKQIIQAWIEPALTDAQAEERFQFERHGYFVADRIDSQVGKPVFNRTVGLKDTWGKTHA
uniref:glutamine--tRNA ligase n=1 Tax=mine drainage metagenome TaxID=410659 RepID=E6QTK5_9ZZZZ